MQVLRTCDPSWVLRIDPALPVASRHTGAGIGECHHRMIVCRYEDMGAHVRTVQENKGEMHDNSMCRQCGCGAKERGEECWFRCLMGAGMTNCLKAWAMSCEGEREGERKASRTL
jgi:hypothetical protein